MTTEPAAEGPGRRGSAREIAPIREGLGELATRALGQVERAVGAWLDADEEAAREVLGADQDLDAMSAALEEQIMSVHQRWATFAADLRFLHMGLIEAVALERVGNLAVEIARLTLATPPPAQDVARVQDAIRAMGERAVDALAEGTKSVVRADVEAGDRACAGWREVEPMLERVLSEVSAIEEQQTSRRWSASAVLVARHLERVANNACELGSRVRFMVRGELGRADGEDDEDDGPAEGPRTAEPA